MDNSVVVICFQMCVVGSNVDTVFSNTLFFVKLVFVYTNNGFIGYGFMVHNGFNELLRIRNNRPTVQSWPYTIKR